MISHVGFIGLGTMGKPMAKNLCDVVVGSSDTPA
jgi:3-hydroxyisobutyrate dehydrogenase-like beta-hydroxyacid dehydrogenase